MCEEKHYTLKKAISLLIQAELEKQLIKAVKYWGVEGTEDKIKKIYSRHIKLRDNLLKNLHRLYKY